MADHDSLAAALVAALADLTVVEKGRKVDFTTDSGKRVHYDYADLPAVITLTRPVLAEHGVVALTPVHAHGNGLACTVTLLHSSGDRMDFEPFPFPHGKDAQATGSMVTYHRRYALVAALGMAAGDDDDGAAAAPRQAEPVEDPAIPGLRTSIEGAIGKLSDQQKADLKVWMAAEDLPPVRRMNAGQADRMLEHLMDLRTEPTDAPTLPLEGTE